MKSDRKGNEVTMSVFKKISAQDIKDNPFRLIGDDWGLVTAAKDGSVNMMTVSWGGVGVMWNKPVAFTFIRPQRYTFGFLESESGFTISFFDEDCRKALQFCGSKSGRDYDKVKETGLTVVYTEEGLPTFAEARLVLVCKKLYAQPLNEESIVEKEMVSPYYQDDYHKMYISEITEVLVK